MTTVYDVPADVLIKTTADKLKEKIKLPEFAKFVKTGVGKEKSPAQRDWWWVRTAAILRKVYLKGPVGVSRLAGFFSSSRDRGTKPDRASKGSRAIVRHALKQLEEIGYVKTEKGKGRRVTPQGQSFLDNTAHEVALKLKESSG